MPQESPGIRNEALRLYDALGWFTLPTDPGAKKPYYGFTYKDRYGDALPAREEIETWPEWSSEGVRLGTRTGAVSGIIVLDCDSKEAHGYIKEKGHPIGPMVQSPRENGGLHLYFRHPGFYVKSVTNFAGVDGLDVRGDYGIVVLPPSPDHKTGRSYEWIISPDEVEIPQCPDWLIELLKKQSDFKPPLDVAKTLSGVPEGQRDTELNRLAGKFRQMNIPEDIAVPMIELAAENCKPAFNKAEARAKVKWAYTHYEAGEDLSPILSISKNGGRKEDEEEFTADYLLDQKFDPVKWIIPGMLPEGSMLFGGKPKMGKSWLALHLCIAVATGGSALGEFRAEPGDALYLALEDNRRRLQSRMKELIQSEALGESGDLSRLTMRTKAQSLDTGLIHQIEGWLETRPGARLVVIDTLGSVKSKGSSSKTLYEQDYEIGSKLTELANAYHVAILIIHHLRKGDAEDPMDMVSGSTGLTGGMDGAMVLIRTRSAADGILRAYHRDLENDPELALQKVEASAGWWRYIGPAEEYLLGKERGEILNILSNADEPMRPTDIAEAIGKPSKNVSALLLKMLDSGHVDSAGYGRYVASAAPPPELRVVTYDGSDGSDGTSTSGLSSAGSTTPITSTSSASSIEEGEEF